MLPECRASHRCDPALTARLMVPPPRPGFTSLITADALARAQAATQGGGGSGSNGSGSTGPVVGSGASPGGAALPDWEPFRAAVVAGTERFPSRRHPFLFAGARWCRCAVVPRRRVAGRGVGCLSRRARLAPAKALAQPRVGLGGMFARITLAYGTPVP